jgi:hypothetical protein
MQEQQERTDTTAQTATGPSEPRKPYHRPTLIPLGVDLGTANNAIGDFSDAGFPDGFS